MYLTPRRAAGLFDNAVAAAKIGNKPYPYVMVIHDSGLHTAGIGQFAMVEDSEHGDDGHGEAVALAVSEAEEVSKAIRGVPGAARKDTQVSVTVRDDVLIVEMGEDVIVEVADIGDEADEAWRLRLDAQPLYDSPIERADRVAVFDTTILSVLAKLKPSGESRRAVIYPSWAKDTALFRLGSTRGFIQGNATPAEELLGQSPEGDSSAGAPMLDAGVFDDPDTEEWSDLTD